jgi:hypothetical protein
MKGTSMSVIINGKPVGQSSKGVVTTADVHRWRVEREAVFAQIEELTEQHLLLERKLEAAAVLFPDLENTEPFELRAEPAAEVVPQPQTKDEAHAPGESVTEAITRVLATANRSLAPIEIRAALHKDGLQLSENYLYTAIKRAANRGKIQRYGKKYRMPRTSFPQGETRSHQAPGPLGLTASGGAVDAVPEVGGT